MIVGGSEIKIFLTGRKQWVMERYIFLCSSNMEKNKNMNAF